MFFNGIKFQVVLHHLLVDRAKKKYIKTCLEQNLGITETCLQWKTLTIPSMCSLKDPNFKYLLQQNLPATEKYSSLAVLLQAGFTVDQEQVTVISLRAFQHIKYLKTPASKYIILLCL